MPVRDRTTTDQYVSMQQTLVAMHLIHPLLSHVHPSSPCTSPVDIGLLLFCSFLVTTSGFPPNIKFNSAFACVSSDSQQEWIDWNHRSASCGVAQRSVTIVFK